MLDWLSKAHNNLIKVLEIIGKPILFCFLTLVVVGLLLFQLLTNFVRILLRSLKRSIYYLSSLPNLSLPRPRRSPSLSRHSSAFFTSKRRFIRRFVIFLTILNLSLVSGTYFFYELILRDLPSPARLRETVPSLSTKIYDRHGTLLYQVYSEENRTLIPLGDLPPHLIQATVASEDQDFYRHRGLSWAGIARALRNNMTTPYLQGGSTITQQLVKVSLLSPERTLTRKLKEMVLALWLETIYTKAEILEMYFNYVPYGGTVYGIEAASREIFGKSATNLSLAEAALLAGLPAAPTTFSPFGTHPYLAKYRQTQVLDRMVAEGYLDAGASDAAKSESLRFKPQNTNIRAPHFVMYIKSILVNQLGEDVVNHGGLEVTTTLDYRYQQILESEINRELARLTKLRVKNGAGLAVNPQNGEILAMAGSRNYFDTDNDGQVNVVLQPRQPGSSIKPITYALAFLNGLTPTTRIDDRPICYISRGQPDYCPTNYDSRFHGRITLRAALANSYNIPATKLLNSLGISRMVDLARRLGITSWDDPSRFGLSLTLGSGEVTMLDLAQVYSVFANGGDKIPLNGIISVKTQSGAPVTLPSLPQPMTEVIPASVAYQITSILSDRQARAPAFGYNSILNLVGFPAAVKTGTTNSLRDNWTIGYTPNLLVATWVGNNDNSPMSSVASGITGASPIWHQTMQQLLAGTQPLSFPVPKQLVAVAICPSTGLAYCPGLCQTTAKTEVFVPGTEPKQDCTRGGAIGEAATSVQSDKPPSPLEFFSSGKRKDKRN